MGVNQYHQFHLLQPVACQEFAAETALSLQFHLKKAVIRFHRFHIS